MKNDIPELQINKTTQKSLPKPKHLINLTTKQKKHPSYAKYCTSS
jgi:hypothetical protein